MKNLICTALSLMACSLASAADIKPAIAEFDSLRFARAQQLFAPLAKSGEHRKQANYYLGRIAIATNNYSDAKTFLEESVKIQPGRAEEYFWLGNAYLNLMQRSSLITGPGLLSSFRKNTEAAAELSPDYVPALMSLYQYNVTAPAIVGGSLEKAEELLKKIDTISKPHGDMARLFQLNRNKQGEKAVALAQSMITAYPDSDEALLEAGKTLSTYRRFPEALAALEKVTTMKVTPDNYPRVQSAYYEIGQAYFRKRADLDRGIEALSKASQLFPVNGTTNWSYFRLAQIYQLKGDTAQQKNYLELLEKTGVQRDNLLVKTMESQLASSR